MLEFAIENVLKQTTPNVRKVSLYILILKNHIGEIFCFRVGIVPLLDIWDD